MNDAPRSRNCTAPLRPDLAAIAEMIPGSTRVLDIGCGDGALLEHLVRTKLVDGRGLELSQQNVNQWVILPDGRKCYPSNTPGTPCPGPQPGVFNPTWGNTSILSPSGNSSYNAAVASITQNLSNGLRVQGGYTFGKTISLSDTVFGADFSSDAGGGLTDPYNAKMDRGLAGYNLKSSFNLSYTYDVPFKGSGWIGKTIQGWQISGIIRSQSGIPFGATTATSLGTSTSVRM